MTDSPEGLIEGWIEESRRRLNIPANWVYEMCANDCGELVWLPPDVRATAEQQGTPLLVTCSSACAMAVFKRHA